MVKKSQLASLFPLHSERLELRIFERSDISEQYVSWLNDKEVVKYSNQRFLRHTLHSCEHYFNSLELGNSIFVAVIEKNSGAMIGTLTIHFNPHHGTADIGIMLGNTLYWGKGFGQETWSTALLALLKTSGIRKVTAGAIACNEGMINIMKNTGMEPDGVRTDHEVLDGAMFDIVHFAKFRK